MMTLEQVRNRIRLMQKHFESITTDDGTSYANRTRDRADEMRNLADAIDFHLSQPQPVAQGYVSHDCDGDPVWSFANGESIYSIVKHPEGHQLVHTDGGALKLISKPFNLVAQVAAVTEMSLHDRVEFALRDAGFDLDEASRIAGLTKPWTKGAVAKVRVTHEGYGMELSQHVAYALPDGDYWLYATPTIPTGHRVVPDGWEIEDAGRGFVRIKSPKDELHIGYMPTPSASATTMLRDLACAMLAASPFTGGV